GKGHLHNRKVMTTGLLVSGIFIALYIVGQFVHTSWDATEERRYTLTRGTRTVLENLEDRIYIRILLDGRFPASFKRLQDATAEMIQQFARINPEIAYNFDDP